MKKKKPIGKLVDHIATRLQLLVRMKAANDHGFCQCVTCDAFKHYKDMQGGHFIPRGCSETKLLEENIHPQCNGCNGFGMKFGTSAHIYTLYMQDMYGRDFVEHLIECKRAKRPVKWNRCELEQQLEDINTQIRDQKRRLGEA
jgi:hypothetical protein